jgi:hypothetical protein
MAPSPFGLGVTGALLLFKEEVTVFASCRLLHPPEGLAALERMLNVNYNVAFTMLLGGASPDLLNAITW